MARIRTKLRKTEIPHNGSNIPGRDTHVDHNKAEGVTNIALIDIKEDTKFP